MDFDSVFNRAMQELLKRCPPGKRTFRNFQLLFHNKYGNDPETRDIVRGFYTGEDELYRRMEASSYDVDLKYPYLKDKFSWGSDMESIGLHREDFSEMVFDNQFLLRLARSSRASELAVGIMPGLGERGNRYYLIDLVNGIGYSVKPYQGDHEKPVMLAFSGNIGPEIYSAGECSFVEELMLELNIPNALNVRYLTLHDIHPFNAGELIGHVFAAMHSCNVIFDACNCLDEVRLKVSDGKREPKILDFGSALIWPKRDFLKRHEKPLEELVETDLEYVRSGIRFRYCKHSRGIVLQSFEATYQNYLNVYRESFAPQIRPKLEAFEPMADEEK